GSSASEAADPSGVPLPAPFPRQATQLLPRWGERARKAPWPRAQVPRCSALLALPTNRIRLLSGRCERPWRTIPPGAPVSSNSRLTPSASMAAIKYIRLHICVPRRSKRSAGKAPAHPVAQGFAHDQLEIAALQPGQLLGEHRHALPPGTGHPRNVGAPEHPIRTERVEAAAEVLVEAAERIRIFGV